MKQALSINLFCFIFFAFGVAGFANTVATSQNLMYRWKSGESTCGDVSTVGNPCVSNIIGAICYALIMIFSGACLFFKYT